MTTCQTIQIFIRTSKSIDYKWIIGFQLVMNRGLWARLGWHDINNNKKKNEKKKIQLQKRTSNKCAVRKRLKCIEWIKQKQVYYINEMYTHIMLFSVEIVRSAYTPQSYKSINGSNVSKRKANELFIRNIISRFKSIFVTLTKEINMNDHKWIYGKYQCTWTQE